MYGGLKVYKIVILGDGGVGKTALTYQVCVTQGIQLNEA